ncbi:MAG: hypothetical protein LBR66_04155 [Candidatus Symbiothrix sp.]|jgi:hypothetical protein|nr:hypothetical protein [Candidatus Symbiothrix sp.]
MKKIIITLVIALTVGGAVSAQEFWGQTQREYKQTVKSGTASETAANSGSLRGLINGTDTPSENPGVPVGEGLFFLVLMGGAYALRKRSSLRA